MSDHKLKSATVLRATRRYLFLLDAQAQGNIIKGIMASKALEATIGDVVQYTENNDKKPLITQIQKRKNLLYRSFGSTKKRIAANLDHLYIVTAPIPLFNTIFIDRILAAAHHESINCSIIVNKVDLGLSETETAIDCYRKLGIPIISCSAKTDHDLTALKEKLEDANLKTVALAGISGVGKSSILKKLLPGVEIATAKVSAKTGQGRQTTSASFAYQYRRNNAEQLFIIDLPGVQNFGISHLDRMDILRSFSEFTEHSAKCEYYDCFHLEEPECGVKDALSKGLIAESRYASYLDMLAELEQNRRY